jgi:uncharacterized protein YdeI (YjbR/CyaY-like superfamily)
MDPMFFATPADFRGWLEQHHATQKELLVGYYKKGTGKPSITWAEPDRSVRRRAQEHLGGQPHRQP